MNTRKKPIFIDEEPLWQKVLTGICFIALVVSAFAVFSLMGA